MAFGNGTSPPIGHGQKLESLGVLAGGIAHDFNNLLAGVVGNADLACELLPPDSPAREALQRITEGAQRASALCGQLLAYAGRGRFERQPVDLGDLVRQMAPLLHTASAGQASIEFDIADDLAWVDADPDQIRQAVLNLVTNAVEALGDSAGVVRVSARNVGADDALPAEATVDGVAVAGRSVRLSIRDDGHGLDDVTRARMFEPYFSRKAAGRGLGLPATLGIVRRHGGAMAVRSGEARGTTIDLQLPATKHAPRHMPPLHDSRPDPARGSVLVVDDEPVIQEVVAKILAREGFSVLLADDGEAALRVFREHGPEIGLVLLDLTMPTMGGRVALRHLRALAPALPVVLMSGYHEQHASPEPDVGPVGFVQKPFRRLALLDAVRGELGRRARA